MIRFIKQKLIHKKWMVICLLIGNILLAAIASSNPMYKNAALEKTLNSKFEKAMEETKEVPGVLSMEAELRAGKGSSDYYKSIEELAKGAPEELGITPKYMVRTSKTVKIRGEYVEARGMTQSTKTMRLASMTELDKHIKMVAGQKFDGKKLADGSIPVILSQKAMTKLDVILNDKIKISKFNNSDGSPMVVTIVGVFDASDYNDNYWVKSPSEYYTEMFVDQSLFDQLYVNLDNPTFDITSSWDMIFDHTSIKPQNVDSIIEKTEDLIVEAGRNARVTAVREARYLTILRDYQTTAKKVYTTLLILQIPVLSLLLAFIFMISRQMLDLEQNEIALLKSRGSSRMQIIFIYFLQSAILSISSCIVGIPLAFVLTKILGSTNGFLEFIQRRALNVTITGEVFLYALGAIIVSILVMVLPVIRESNVTIVNVKQKKNAFAKSIFSKVYLDVILLIVSLYGFYSFSARKEELMKEMLEGGSLDPFLFICSSLFIISASIVGLRIQPLLIKIVYYIGKRAWKPSFQASFLQIIRTRKKQGFMMVFLMFTVSLGMFNSTVARTILSNSDKSIEYTTGADVVLEQPWEDNSLLMQYYPDLELTYTEPDFGEYEGMEGVESATKVYVNNEIETSYNSSSEEEEDNNVSTTLMAIDTKSFGETVSKFNGNLLPVHINRYLNAIARKSDAVLLSDNYRTKYNLKIGDEITYKNDEDKEATGIVYGFVNYFPGYNQMTTELKEESETLVTSEHFLIVANLTEVQQNFGLRPYQVWLKTKGSSKFIYDYAQKNNISYTKFEDVNAKKIAVKNDALFQGTNGILTMSFIVILILCSTGFLIYWILSIRQRELLFGVFRAMGMSKRDVIQMLVNEQIFSSGVSIIIGTIIGVVSSQLFVPLVQIFYATTDQTIPLEVVSEKLDLVRLFSVIGIVIIICMVVLGKLISKINISQALKLGED